MRTMARLRWLENARTGDEGTVCTHTNKLFFDDTSAYINASASGTLDLVATTIAVTGNQTISGSLVITGGLTYGSETVSLNQNLQGTLTVGVNDTGYDVLFYGAGTGKYWLWDEDADGVVLVGTFTETGNMAVTGTFTLTGAPSITGNMDIVGTLSVGVDNTGHDVKFFGATTLKYWEWDESADQMVIAGSSDQTGDAQLTGALTVGVDNTGHDVIFYGEGSTYQWKWDQNADTEGGVIMKGTWTCVGAVGITGAVSITGAVGITGDVTMATADQINFRDTNTYIQSTGANVLEVIAPTFTVVATTGIIFEYDSASYLTTTVTDAGAVKMAVTGDSAGSFEIETDDAGITLDAANNITLDAGTGDVDFTTDALFATAEKCQFRDTAIYLGSSADGQLDIVADGKIALALTGGYFAPEGMSDRYRLTWVAGARGIPSANASILNATEATRMICDPNFECLGTGGGAISVAHYAEGGIALVTDGTDGHGLVILPHLDASQTAWKQVTWGTDKEVRWECEIKTGSAITTCIIWAGLKLTNTPTTITDADQVFFRYDPDVQAGVWECVSSIADSDDAHDSTVTVATNTVYHLVIEIASNRTAKFYINGTLRETSAALTDTIDLIPYIGIEEDGASAARTLYVRGQSISRAY